MFDLRDHPHRRFNPLTGEWLLVSPHRAKRPWQGQQEDLPSEGLPQHDPSCYLCPGNERAGGVRNPDYADTFVFHNDFPALVAGSQEGQIDREGLIVAESESGVCRVLCFSPRHDIGLSRMELPAVRRVVDVWAEEYRVLGASPDINYVQIFENRGAMMGCSNPHPHCQIWANRSIPNEPSKEDSTQREYLANRGRCLLCEYLSLESALEERIVIANGSFLVVVPFWATWPFETLLISRRHAPSLDRLDQQERDDLADILKRLTTRYDNLFRTSFPYSMGFHQSPTDGQDHACWHLHAHFYPPLLRSATVRKFMVGYELLATPQRDITAESAAGSLRELSEVHYLEA